MLECFSPPHAFPNAESQMFLISSPYFDRDVLAFCFSLRLWRLKSTGNLLQSEDNEVSNKMDLSIASSIPRLLLFYSALLLLFFPAMHAIDDCLKSRRAAGKRSS